MQQTLTIINHLDSVQKRRNDAINTIEEVKPKLAKAKVENNKDDVYEFNSEGFKSLTIASAMQEDFKRKLAQLAQIVQYIREDPNLKGEETKEKQLWNEAKEMSEDYRSNGKQKFDEDLKEWKKTFSPW
ncbi:uncharacterized protein IL334_004633 [Kwoniella shivajii]|uniref:Uncharacterized protein n=1 Tax=Kwoniella shivajii TaxID=564305 RepID=A0ABZ1D0W3_9TREE|nr:hypothetical protein IL334_004633 [Kwoniella shivajii]